MKEVVVTLQPFDFEQRIYMFEDGHLKMNISSSMADLPERIVKVCLYDGVTEVTIKGAIDFTAKIKEQIRDKELTEYGKSLLNIHLA